MKRKLSPRLHAALLMLCVIIPLVTPSKSDHSQSPPLAEAFETKIQDPTKSEIEKGVQIIWSEKSEKQKGKPKETEEKKPGEWSNWQGSPLSWSSTGGVVETSKTDPGEWSEATFEIHRRLVSLGYNGELAEYMVDQCKAETIDPRHCVVTMGFLGKNESQAGKTAHRNNVFGFRNTHFPSTKAAVDAWIRNYKKKWYKTKGPGAFYSPKPGLPATRYCTDEVQPDGRILPYCPNWYRNAMIAYKILTK